MTERYHISYKNKFGRAIVGGLSVVASWAACPGDDIALVVGALSNQVDAHQINDGLIPEKIVLKLPEKASEKRKRD